MSITAILILVFVIFLFIGYLMLNRYLAECGALAQKSDRKKKHTVVQNTTSDIEQGIMSNIIIRDQCWDKFGPYSCISSVGSTKEYPISVTICAAPDGDESSYCKYIASASEGWQQNGLDDFTEDTSALSALEKNYLDAMIRPVKAHTSAERRSKIWEW